MMQWFTERLATERSLSYATDQALMHWSTATHSAVAASAPSASTPDGFNEVGAMVVASAWMPAGISNP